jgi:hypothetical protein
MASDSNRQSAVWVAPVPPNTSWSAQAPARLLNLSTQFSESDVADTATLLKILKTFAQAIQTISNVVGSCPILSGVLLQNVKITVGSQYVPHRLGRAWTGMIPIPSHGVSWNGYIQPLNVNPLFPVTQFIWLFSSVNGTFDLWVF